MEKTTYTEARKQAIYKWRETHPEQYKNTLKKYQEQNKEKINDYYQQNKEKLQKYDLERKNKKYADNEDFKQSCKQKALARYYYKKELQLFMNILLD